MGELDPNFGNHPALLALTLNGRPVAGGPELVVPGDSAPLRSVFGASKVTVGIATAPATNTNPSAGSPVEVIYGHHVVTLSAALLARLPSETLKVSFQGPGGTQTHTEIGPSLPVVLAAAGIFPTLNTWVAAAGDDNYVATVTPAEQFVGGRPLQLSLNEDGVDARPAAPGRRRRRQGRPLRLRTSSTSTSAPARLPDSGFARPGPPWASRRAAGRARWPFGRLSAQPKAGFTASGSSPRTWHLALEPG